MRVKKISRRIDIFPIFAASKFVISCREPHAAYKWFWNGDP